MSATKIFQRRIEDFICEQCGILVAGNGYTNHCPKCLYSKHVDDFPGDRLNPCGGLMESVRYEKEHGQDRLVQVCLRCGFFRKNKVQKEDQFEALLSVVRKKGNVGP